MKKIILDLNIPTNALWKGREEEIAKRFMFLASSFLFQSFHISNKISIHTFLNFTSKLFRVKIPSHNVIPNSELFKDFVTTSRKTLSDIPLKIMADENEAITKLTFNQSFSTATNLTLAYGYLGTVNTRGDSG